MVEQRRRLTSDETDVVATGLDDLIKVNAKKAELVGMQYAINLPALMVEECEFQRKEVLEEIRRREDEENENI